MEIQSHNEYKETILNEDKKKGEGKVEDLAKLLIEETPRSLVRMIS